MTYYRGETVLRHRMRILTLDTHFIDLICYYCYAEAGCVIASTGVEKNTLRGERNTPLAPDGKSNSKESSMLLIIKKKLKWW